LAAPPLRKLPSDLPDGQAPTTGDGDTTENVGGGTDPSVFFSKRHLELLEKLLALAMQEQR
jgi:hypothetical protein